MGASKTPSRNQWLVVWRGVRFLSRPQNRGLVLAGLIVATALGGACYGWRRWGAATINGKDYLVTADRIQVTPQPAWIHANVKQEVLRTVGQGSLHLQDRGLVENLAQAFALHPWVARVERVEKRYPAQVHLELLYRQPVLVVKLDAAEDRGLLFVDQEGVLLPSDDFASSQARDYLRISAAGEAPTGSYGSPWGSQRIAGAARLAAAWGRRWQPLGLYWLVGVRPPSGELLYELRTQDDRVRVVWGPAPGSESTDEPSAEEKILALERYQQDKGPLSRPDAAPLIDLRELARAATERTARSP